MGSIDSVGGVEVPGLDVLVPVGRGRDGAPLGLGIRGANLSAADHSPAGLGLLAGVGSTGVEDVPFSGATKRAQSPKLMSKDKR